jgi:hypothetical protein
LLAEAERLRLHGWVLLREVMEAMKTPPEEPEKLKTLFLDLESASALLTRSREIYLSAKEKASDPASIDETVSILGRILDIAARQSVSIKSRLK